MTDLDAKPTDAGTTPPSTLARLMLVKELQKLVKQDGRRAPELAAAMGVGRRTVDRWLNGENQDTKAGQVIQLCSVLGYGHDHETTQTLLWLAQVARRRGVTERLDWFAEYEFGQYLGLEAEARRIQTYESTLIPGLLQTGDYAASFMHAIAPELSDEAITERVKVRLDRQRVLTREDRPTSLTAFIDEGAIRRSVPDIGMMREQLAHLTRVGKQDNVEIRIIPFAAGPYPAGSFGPFVTMWFDTFNGFEGVGPITYVETPKSAEYGETEEQTHDYLLMLDRLSAVALSTAESATMITAARDAVVKDG